MKNWVKYIQAAAYNGARFGIKFVFAKNIQKYSVLSRDLRYLALDGELELTLSLLALFNTIYRKFIA